MPCPNGVNIPYNFELFNKGAMMDMWGQARFRYSQMLPLDRAASCIDCGECEQQCPQSIPISDWMPYLQDVMGAEKEWDGRTLPNA
jgi:hypothetical protein